MVLGQRDGVWVITLTQKDFNASFTTANALLAALESGDGGWDVVVDLTWTLLMTPSMIGLVHSIYMRTRVKGGRLMLAGASPCERRVLERTDVTGYFTFYRDVDEAVRSVRFLPP